jgi:N-acetylated-alpha-linked acidic dipeptidase
MTSICSFYVYFFAFWQLYSPPEDYESKLSFFTNIADAISRTKRYNGREQHLALHHQIMLIARAIRRVGQVVSGEPLLGG